MRLRNTSLWRTAISDNYFFRAAVAFVIMQASRRELLTPHGSRIASAVWLLVTAPCPCGSGAAPLSLSRTPANWKRTQGSPLSRPKRSWRPPPSSVPRSGASGGKGCGAAPPLRFVPLSIATAYHAQMARIQRGSSSISRAFNALPTRIPYFLPVFPTRFERTPGVGLASI